MLKASYRGASALLRRRAYRRLFYKVGEFFGLLWTYGKALELQPARMAHCRQCPLFDAEHQTCGTAGTWYNNPEVGQAPLGCWCYLPVKTATLCNCWLYDRVHGEGWPAELNSFHL
jgi:hypothetical protein